MTNGVQALGFSAIAGEAKVQLLPAQWPKDSLPPPTASLLSVASRRGLAAAAGPESVVVARTESIRKAFMGEKTGDGQVRAFTPEMTLPLGMRVSQVAFTADENYLVLSAEQGGGLAVYEVDGILQGKTDAAFQMATGGSALRALVPNPAPDMGEILALATMDGKLMVANLKERSFAKVNNGEALTENVSCISWSARGKQLVAGLGDGTASQFTPQGVLKAQIPRPPSLDGSHHGRRSCNCKVRSKTLTCAVSSMTWLENDVFLMVHNPGNPDSNPPTSIFHLVTRAKGTQQYLYQKIGDPSPNFGLDRSPPHHFMLRLRDFPPALSDMLIVSSTASTDIGLLTKSASPLSSDVPSDQITNCFTLTEMSDDSRRAQMPVSEEMMDTSPIGAALDLSSSDPVPRPIPGDEMDMSKTPLPGFMVLNNEGVLAFWWVVYIDSVRQGTAYPGLAALGGQAVAAAPSRPAFGQSAFGASTSSTNAFGGSVGSGSSFAAPKPAGGAFAAPAFGAPAFGTPAATTATTPKPAGGAFGAPAFGAPAFGAPAFGTPAAPAAAKPAFGTPSAFGQRASPWAAGTTAAATPAFGQSGLGSSAAAPAKPGAAFGSSIPASGGFASFASKPGFAGVAASSGGESIFGKPATGGSAFGKPAENASAFGGAAATPSGGIFGSAAPSTGSAFGSTAPTTGAFGSSTTSAFGSAAPSTGAFGSGGGFKLNSGFTADPSQKDDNEKPVADSSMFGSGFGKVLGEVKEAETVPSPEADMDDDTEEPAPPTAPSTTPAAPPPTTSNIFGSKPAVSSPLANAPKTGSLFGAPAAETKAEAKPSMFGNLNKTTPAFGSAFGAPKPVEKETPPPASMLEAPLPPDPASKPLFGAGESSASSVSADAPLPPDFTKPEPKTESTDAPLPPDFVAAKPKPKADSTDAPLPPDFMPAKPATKLVEEKEEVKVKEEKPDSSPVILPAAGDDGDDSAGFSEEEPGNWDESEDGEHEEEEDEEGRIPEVESHTPEDSPQQQSLFSKRAKPEGRQLFGEINRSAPTFPPPPKRDDLRSPSPQRSSALPPHMRGRPDVNRSVSAPMAASQILGSRPAPSKPEFKETLAHQQEEAARRERAEEQRKKDEAQALVDEDDERNQAYLNRDIEPTLRLDEFVAHTDYVGDADKDSVPYQVEAVFRDINSMIDTLGMNSRALKAFIKGHSELYPDEERTREDLEKPDEWCLDEIERLSTIIDFNLREELDEGRVLDIAEKMKVVEQLNNDAVKLRSRKDELHALLSTTLDPDHAALARTQPLTAEQAAHQHELRAAFAKLQKQIAEAEESLIMLRTKLASALGVNGKAAPGPTVEAVIRTVTKMTAMAEKRSGDIDVLENQMRRLRFTSVDRDRTPTREMSPFASPMKNNFRNSIAYERPFTPERSISGGRRDFHQSFSASMRSSQGAFNPNASMRSDRTFNPSASMRSDRGFSASMRSTQGFATPPRKKLDGFSKDDQSKIKGRAEKRQEVVDLVRRALEKRGSRVYPMD